MALSTKTCTPCRGGVDPMDRATAERYLREVPEWSLSSDGKRIQRAFKFKNFAQALEFVNKIGQIAEEQGHHPEVSFGWGHAEVEIWTHKIGGLHENDFILAAKTDAVA